MNQCWFIVSWTLGKKISEFWIGILLFSFKKMHLKMSSGKMAAILSRLQCVEDNGSVSSWWSVCGHSMMTSSNGNIFRVTGPLCGEFTGYRWIPGTKSSDAELWCFDPWSSKQWWGWWFEAPSRPTWRHCNGTETLNLQAAIISIIQLGWPKNSRQRVSS